MLNMNTGKINMNITNESSKETLRLGNLQLYLSYIRYVLVLFCRVLNYGNELVIFKL